MRASRPTAPTALAALAFAALIVVAACGGAGTATPPASAPPSAAPGKASVAPYIVSSRQVVGENRLLFSFIDAEQNLPAATPERTASVAFVPPGSTTAGDPLDGTFIWGVEGERGLYVVTTTFDVPGIWTAVFITEAPGTPEERVAMTFEVAEDSPAVGIGDPAPASDTPTAADVGGDLERLATDTNPVPRFYTTSVAEAIDANEPFVLAFATPAFCRSAQCGPTLDRVKEVAEDYPDVTFINVEPFELEYTEGRLQPVLDAANQFRPVPSVLEWGILSEPWVYVVDGGGIVRGSFEGVFADEELRDVVKSVAGASQG